METMDDLEQGFAPSSSFSTSFASSSSSSNSSSLGRRTQGKESSVSSFEKEDVIHVKTLEKTFEVKTKQGESVREFKRRLLLEIGSSGDDDRTKRKKLRLIYMGRMLKDNEVVNKVVKPESVVHCVITDQAAAMDSNRQRNGLRDAEIEFPPAEVDIDYVDRLIEADRRLALRLQRLEANLNSSEDEDDEDAYDDDSNEDEQIEERTRVRRNSTGGSNMALRRSDRERRNLSRLRARLSRMIARSEENGTTGDTTNLTEQRTARIEFFTGFVMGFVIGVLMLFWMRDPSLSRHQKRGILFGVGTQFFLGLISQTSNTGSQYNREEEDIFKEEDTIFQAINNAQQQQQQQQQNPS